jgi:EAL domain-containing protein (putative c-di-GMP-specific phosphodiesterase class I)
MVLVSINRFRLINELYGREFAEKIIITLADKLRSCVLGRNGLVGQDGSSTFLIYCEHQDSYEMVPAILNEAIKEVVNDINVSFKIAVYPNVDPSLDKEIVIGRVKTTADTLLDDYTKPIVIYNHEKQEKTLHMEELIDLFPTAIQEEQFKLFFQPKYEIQGDKPVFTSAEVLIRWISPKFGFISPGEFIPLFEENGLIGKLDAYIMEKAAEYMASWKKKYDVYVPLSLNLSRIDIYRPNIVEEIIGYVDSNNIPRDKYYIEITESAFVEDSKAVIPVINKIRDSGFKIEIDDFGSGYSSFNALADLPFDILKIDMAFIRSMDKNPKVKDIIKMIINLSKMLNAVTISEGVETAEQYAFLKENGCDIIQGYYLSKPLPLNDFEDLIQKEFVKDER